MKKFIPLLIMTIGVFSLVSCRQSEEIETSMPDQMKITKIKPAIVNDSTTIIQTLAEETDPPAKDPMKW